MNYSLSNQLCNTFLLSPKFVSFVAVMNPRSPQWICWAQVVKQLDKQACKTAWSLQNLIVWSLFFLIAKHGFQKLYWMGWTHSKDQRTAWRLNRTTSANHQGAWHWFIPVVQLNKIFAVLSNVHETIRTMPLVYMGNALEARGEVDGERKMKEGSGQFRPKQ